MTNLPKPQIDWLSSKEWNLLRAQLFSTGVTTFKKIKKYINNKWNSHFPGFFSFSMIFFTILKLHDISMTGKAADTFPGAVGTLYISPLGSPNGHSIVKLQNQFTSEVQWPKQVLCKYCDIAHLLI